MTNGNDLLEYEEDNIQQLEEDFLLRFTSRELRDFILENEGVMNKFKKEREDDWHSFVDEEHTNTLCAVEDLSGDGNIED